MLVVTDGYTALPAHNAAIFGLGEAWALQGTAEGDPYQNQIYFVMASKRFNIYLSNKKIILKIRQQLRKLYYLLPLCNYQFESPQVPSIKIENARDRFHLIMYSQHHCNHTARKYITTYHTNSTMHVIKITYNKFSLH